MTQPQRDRRSYVTTVLKLYVMLPQTPARARPADRKLAEHWFLQEITIQTVESALLLGQIRRLGRPVEYPKLGPIRSLHYFAPVLEEVMAKPISEDYVGYIKSKLSDLETTGRKYMLAAPLHSGA
jgi:hypothetical protein